jgi:hypothetical protein
VLSEVNTLRRQLSGAIEEDIMTPLVSRVYAGARHCYEVNLIMVASQTVVIRRRVAC